MVGDRAAASKACLDVAYRPDGVVAACVGFREWADDHSAFECVTRSKAPPAAYEPGAFWRREMPHLLAVLAHLESLPKTLIVDGYVWLADEKPGLGARLFEALGGRAAVIGVAKTRFRGAEGALSLLRGSSKEPLFIGAVGMPLDEAGRAIAQMAGAHRVPTLLRRVDRLSRDG